MSGESTKARPAPTNREYMEHEPVFRAACREADTPPTKRQASKYRREQGIAFKTRRRLLSSLPLDIERHRRTTWPWIDKLERVADSLQDDLEARREVLKLMDLLNEPLVDMLNRLEAIGGSDV